MARKGSKKYKTAQRLGEIYLSLRVFAGELQEIAEEYGVEGIGRILLDDIRKIEQADHDIIKLAHKLVKEED